MDVNHIVIIFLLFGGIFFIYLGLGGPLLSGGKIETQKFGIFAILIGILFSLIGVFFSLGLIGITEKNRLEEVEKARVKSEEGTEMAKQAHLQTEAEKKLAEAERIRLQMETEKKLAEAERARFKAEVEAERTRLKAETQAELAQLKKEVEVERTRLKMEAERDLQKAKSQSAQKEAELERTTHRLKMETEKNTQKVVPQQSVQEDKLPASFDCDQAGTKAEKMICSNEELSDADGRLGKLYSQLEQSVEDSNILKEDQRKWLAHRDQQLEICHQDSHCALQVYEKRIAQLTSSQESLSPVSTKQWWGIVTTPKADPLNIRSDMDTHAKVIDTVAQGEKILVLANYGKWYQVQSSEKTIGFAASQFIKSATPLQWGRIVTEASDLNVRAEMKANASVIGKVKKNTKISILETHGDWYQVQLENGLTGYVAKQFIQLEE